MTLSDSRNKARALGRIKRLASSGLPLDPFIRGVFEAVNDGVPHSPNRVILAGDGDQIGAYVGSTEEIVRATPLFQKYFVKSPPLVCGVRFPYDAHALRNVLPSRVIWTQSDLVLDNFFRAEGYNTVYRPMGWHHLLQVVFQESGEFLGYFPIWRSADQKPFSRDDIEFLRNAAPHIAHGLRAGTLLERRDRPLEQPDEFQSLFPWRTGVILLDCDGKLLAVDPDARGIFQQLGILDGVSVDRFAPAPRTLAAIFPGREPNSERVAAPGIVLKLRGVRMTAADGREYTTVLLERGETAGARRARMSARWGLSQREAEILSFIGDGKTGPEIALLLAISHDTIRKHTSKILDKLGVETRTAAAMLTRNSYDN